jgi:hypothetical protein
MNTDNSSQSNPTLPDHYDVLTHPLVHFREPPSFTNCLDILHNCCYLVDLFGYIDLDGETEGELSEQAANAFFWQTRTLESTLRYVSLCLRALQNNDPQLRKSVSTALLSYEGITSKDIESFVELLKA